MKKLFIFAIAALGMLACTDKNEPDQKSQEEGVIDGKQGDIVGCWVEEGKEEYYYNFSSDGYMTHYKNNARQLREKSLWYIDKYYYPENYYEQLTWRTEMEAPYQCDGNRLTVYAGWTPTYTVEWIDGSHVTIEQLGSFIRIDPQKYFSNFKTVEKDYEKDWQEIMTGHEKHFCVGKDEAHNLKWIKFAPGNIQYQPSTDTWRYAPYQYHTTRSTIYVTLTEENCWVDLFYKSDYDTICSIFAPEWRFLRSAECDVLFPHGMTESIRSNSKKLYFRSTVADVYGLVILPDAWDTPAGMAWPSGVPEYSDQYSAEQWEMMESNGAIFLPATGYSEGGTGSLSYGRGNVGYYMLDGGEALAFSDGKDFDYQTNVFRYYYASVRFVQDVE